MKRLFSLLVAAALSLGSMHAAIKVHTIGDSTMAWYEDTNPKRGWGMFLGAFFDVNFVTVNNAGHSGRDTRQFYLNDWKTLKPTMSAGDYLLIQFAHNDEGVHTNGTDNLDYAAYCEANGLPVPSELRGTNPQTTFRDYLRLFIEEARAIGVTPVLVGPICRAYFQGNNISRKGQHDLGDSFYKIEQDSILLTNQSLPATDLSMSYVEAMRIVGQEKNVPFIDLTEATRQLFVSYGPTECLNQLFVDKSATQKDQTHTNALGANLIAREAAQLLKDAGILADYISIPTTIGTNPASVDFGEVYSGVDMIKEILLTGSGLEPAEGTISIRTASPLMVGFDRERLSTERTLVYSGGSLFQKLYIMANYTESGEQHDTVFITWQDTELALPVTASVTSLDGGSPVFALWTMTDRPAADPEIEGPVSATLTLSHMMTPDAKAEFVEIDGSSSTVSLPRYSNADDAGAKAVWPAGEEDENATRYVDFALTAPTTMDVIVTTIAMDLASHSTSTMCCRVRAGVGDAIANGQELEEIKNMPNKQIVHHHWTTSLTIPAGETLHVRVLPWHESSNVGNGKYICFRNVQIIGQAFVPGEEGIESILNSEVRIQKLLRDGQLLIHKGSRLFNAQGMMIK